MRTHCVSVRFDPAELAQLDAARCTMPRGAYLRHAWSGARLPRPIPAANAEALAQLRGVAANLNQVARHANQGGGLDLESLMDLVARLRRTLVGLV